MTEFTPWSALLGGAILGVAALLLLIFNGRIAGISGIVVGAIKGKDNKQQWRWLFIVGLVLGPFIAAPFSFPLAGKIDTSWILIVVAGFLVGLGTRMGAGCTSGHGICGIGRLSPRSIIATAVFMLAAGIVVFIMRHLIGV